ncbi:hypothetical protein TNCV_2906621 [Trichonephila clavipes]|nr:hypothetical protein TNCV_2906621 [Trichonephila clavipes]
MIGIRYHITPPRNPLREVASTRVGISHVCSTGSVCAGLVRAGAVLTILTGFIYVGTGFSISRKARRLTEITLFFPLIKTAKNLFLRVKRTVIGLLEWPSDTI